MSKDYYSGDLKVSGTEVDGEYEGSIGPSIEFPVGAIIQERYEIIEYLGNGTSAVVYKCLDRLLGNLIVALKVLSAEVVEDPVATTRLYRELLVNSDFDHENIARFYDCIRGPGYIGLVMEFVRGGTLEDLFEDEYIFAADEARSILVQICKALAEIHKAGIVHRDLKPENVLLTETGVVKIADFGLARGVSAQEEVVDDGENFSIFASDATAKKATVTGGVAGSPLYLAPEYIANGQVTPRSDIYAVGVIGYQLLTGREPFPHESLVEMLKAKLKEVPPSVLSCRADTPPELAAIVEKAMSIKPSQRYASAEEILFELKQLNFGSLSQIYSQAFINEQLAMAGLEQERKPILQTLLDLYLWPFKMLVEIIGMFGSVGFAFMALALMTISILVAWAAFGPLIGLNMDMLFAYCPESFLPYLQQLSTLFQPPGM